MMSRAMLWGGWLAAALGAVSMGARAQGPTAPLPSAVETVRPALVRILVAEANYDEGRETKSEASGSGVIISARGEIVTNHHVAGESKRLICTLADRREVEADLVGTDPLTDISVIRLRGAPGETFPFASWGDSSLLAVGDTVYAMGCPLALSQSVTRGIVSNTEMVMPDFASGYALKLDGEDVGNLVRWIGHDATIRPGNSGGPLVDTRGTIVGINEISMGLSGAIPSNLARTVADALIASGKVVRAWTGLNPQPRLRSSSLSTGVLVGGVLPGSPAAKAGIQAGDVLLSIGETNVSVRFAEELPALNQMLAALPLGKPTAMTLSREGKTVTVQMTPIERHEAEPKPAELRPWGICASDISRQQMIDLRRKNTDGVKVVSVRPGGPSGTSKPALSEDDIITEVNRVPVKNMAALQSLTATLVKPGQEAPKVLVAFDRDGERMVTVIAVGAKPDEDAGLEARKAWLGVETQVLLPDIAKALDVPGKKGFRVIRVHEGSSAEKAGLKTGDLILAVDGQALDASQPEDTDVLSELIRQYKIGDTVELSIVSAGKPGKVKAVLDTSPLSAREMKKYHDDNFEFSVRNLAEGDRDGTSITVNTKGVYVEEVTDGGWAALGRLEAGEVVLSVQGHPIQTVAEMAAAMRAAALSRPSQVVLHVARGVEEFFVELPADWPGAKQSKTTKGSTK